MDDTQSGVVVVCRFASNVLGIASALLVVSCGGSTSGGGGSCGSGSGCGGDLTGAWHVTGTCVSLSSSSLDSGDGGASKLPAECQGSLQQAVASAKVTPQDATIEFTADGHYTQSGSILIAESVTYDAACLKALGLTTVNASFCSSLGGQLGQLGSATCQLASGGCACNISITNAFDQQGTYTTSGASVTLDGDAPSAYCVQGQTATVYATGNKGSVGTGRMDLHR
jgi:hypothetical protein